MPINSHIQLNAAMMKRFSFMAEDAESRVQPSRKVPTVYYLDINAKVIKSEKIKKLGTRFGYFSDAEEKILGEAEHVFGQIVELLANWEQGCNYDITTHEDQIKGFANLLIDRSEMRRRQVQELVNKIFQEKYKGNKELLAKHPIKIGMPPIFTDKTGITLMINNTNKNFVVPRNGFYYGSPNGRENCFVLPISPKRAIILYRKESDIFKGIAMGNHKIAIAHVDDEESISAINNSALLMEKIIDQSFVISKTKEELEELLAFIKSDKWDLFPR